MGLNGIVFGALIGALLTRTFWGAVVGAILGQLVQQLLQQGFGTGQGYSGAGQGSAGAGVGAGARRAIPIPEVFFRTTFELMGHVAKSDGRVSEAEIGAARRLMQELNLGPREVELAIDCFRAGKAAGYDADIGVERLRQACGRRPDLLRAFIELQVRAALAGSGMPPLARAILTRVAERLGMSALEFAYLEAALRSRQRANGANRAAGGAGAGGAGGARPAAADTLAEFYAELQVDKNTSDQEVTKAYRRQMSRHHPDKLVANGLPESMAQVAKEKTQRIQEAYEGIRAARGMR